jgi:membrane associated rhomboid family serine protease
VGLYDRSGTGGYQFQRPRFFGGFRLFPPVIRWLFIINGGLYLLLNLLLAPFTIDGIPLGGSNGVLGYYLALWPFGTNFLPWQILTYMFLHGGFFHLFFNMLMLWMFGMELENIWGGKKFIRYYVLCGVGAAVANLLVAPLVGQVGPTVGASGAIFGVLIAFGMLFPDRPVYIYFLLPIPAKFFIIGLIALDLIYGVAGTSDGIAHFAHLGGAAVGFASMLAEKRNLQLPGWWSRMTGGLRNPFSDSRRYEDRHGTKSEVRDARFYDIRTGRKMDDGEKRISQEMIDSILDKIGTGGYQSLTEEEKRILNEASKRMN